MSDSDQNDLRWLIVLARLAEAQHNQSRSGSAQAPAQPPPPPAARALQGLEVGWLGESDGSQLAQLMSLLNTNRLYSEPTTPFSTLNADPLTATLALRLSSLSDSEKIALLHILQGTALPIGPSTMDFLALTTSLRELQSRILANEGALMSALRGSTSLTRQHLTTSQNAVPHTSSQSTQQERVSGVLHSSTLGPFSLPHLPPPLHALPHLPPPLQGLPTGLASLLELNIQSLLSAATRGHANPPSATVATAAAQALQPGARAVALDAAAKPTQLPQSEAHAGSVSDTGGQDDSEPFPVRVYRMLVETEAAGKGDIVSFTFTGRAIQILKPERFMKEIIPNYFPKHKHLSSFKRGLNLYGFERIPRGPEEGAFTHRNFCRGRPDLATQIKKASEDPDAKKEWKPKFRFLDKDKGSYG